MEFCWTTLVVKDLDKSLCFYTELVGLTLNRRFKPNEHMELAFLGNSPTELELIQDSTAEQSVAKGISIGFFIDDKLEKIMEKLKAEGFVNSGFIFHQQFFRVYLSIFFERSKAEAEMKKLHAQKKMAYLLAIE